MTPDAAGIEAALAAGLAAHDYAVNDFGSAAKRDGKYLPGGAIDPGWHGCRCGEWAGYWSDFRAHVAAALLPVVTQAQAEAWPCDDYEAPLTCYTVPNGRKHLTCGGCRAAFPRGPEVQRLYRARADESGA